MSAFLTTNSTLHITLDNQDTVVVVEGVHLTVNFLAMDNKIFDPSYNVSVTIDGYVASLYENAIMLVWDGGSNADHTLVIGATGSVASHPTYASIVMEGWGNAFQNWGQVTGAVALWCEDWASGVIENHGTLAGLSNGGIHLINSTTTDVLNTGTITGAGGMVLLNSTARIANFGDIFSTSLNHGAIHAATGSGGFILRNGNSGLIAGIDEAVIGSAFGDQIINTGLIDGDVKLGAGNDLFQGGRGTVEGDIIGDTGNDTISGGISDNELLGGDGNDVLRGRGGYDTLDGGNGVDVMTGGSDLDVFDFDSVLVSNVAAQDSITDFQKSVDDIDLSTIDAKTTVDGNQAFTFIGASAFSAPGQVRAFQSGGNTIVQVSNDADTSPEMALTLIGLFTLTAGDFVL